MRISTIAAGLLAGLSACAAAPPGAPAPADLHLNKVIAKLERKELVTGIWVSSMDPSNALGLVRSNGYPTAEASLTEPMIDFVLVDMEHTPYDITKLRAFLLGLNSKREVMVKGNLQPNLIPLVRVPPDGDQPLHATVKQVLDAGIFGVVIPHVRTAEEARRLVRACRYAQPAGDPQMRPAGKRGASPIVAAYAWGVPLEEYVIRADVWPLDPRGDLLAVIMIEDPEGVRNIDAILSVPGIGACIFGPYDYSFSSGHYGDKDHADVVAANARVKAACEQHGVPMIGFADPTTIRTRLQEGYPMLLIGSDMDHTGGHGKVLDMVREERAQGKRKE